jgi:hypothetical protein
MALELFLLAVASAFWPLLVAVVLLALGTGHPARMLTSFLVGGLATCVIVGVIIVQLLQAGNVVDGSNPPADPIVYLGAGVIAFVVAAVVQRRPVRVKAEQRDSNESLVTRFMRGSVVLAFVAGVVLNVLPGVFPLVALKDIAQLDYSVAITAAILLLFYVVMFALVEVPLLGYVIAPERTSRDVVRFNSWLSRNKRRVAVIALNVMGVYLLVRGLVALIT